MVLRFLHLYHGDLTSTRISLSVVARKVCLSQTICIKKKNYTCKLTQQVARPDNSNLSTSQFKIVSAQRTTEI